jgi:hypothetical protein
MFLRTSHCVQKGKANRRRFERKPFNEKGCEPAKSVSAEKKGGRRTSIKKASGNNTIWDEQGDHTRIK